MLDKRNQRYVDYLEKLEEKKFTGKIVLELNWHDGIIGSMTRETSPLSGVRERETVRLK